MALTNLLLTDVADVLNNIPSIMSLFPWWLFVEPKLQSIDFKYAYLTKYEYWERNNLEKNANVELSIVGWPDATTKELEDMFLVVDNEILPNLDGCLPVKKWWNTTVKNIRQGSMGNAMRDQKWNLVIRKTYTFTYLIQN